MLHATASAPPVFDAAFRAALGDLFLWRRDVRRFKTTPVSDELFATILDLACLAPSVGNSQPWRFVRVDRPERRRQVRDNFERTNASALQGYEGDRARLYAALKLSGLDEAPIHLAVFADEQTPQGHGLGRQTMPETMRYSTVAAVQLFWLAARAHGVGVGWLSIHDPVAITRLLEVPEGWRLVAYLCVGWPAEHCAGPELERVGWQNRDSTCREVVAR